MPVDPQNDPDFMAAAPHEQMAYLSQTDKDFAKATPQDQLGYLMHIRGLGPISGPKPPAMNMQESNLSTAMNPAPQGVANPQQPAESFALQHPEQQLPLAAASGVGALGAAGVAAAPIAIPALQAAARAHPFITSILASEAIGQARKIPTLGKFIPPYAEMLPWMMGKGKPPSGAGENIWSEKPVFPGANLPENPGTFPGAPLPTNPGTFPGAPLPENVPDLLKANALRAGGRPITSPSDALGQLKAGASVRIPGGATNAEVPLPGKPVQPPFPGPKNYEVTRGADPFTHPNAPPKWQFDQDYSSNVKQYGYHPDSQTISVMYKRGGVYQFKATPQQYNQMLKAPSAGGYLHDVIEPSQTRGAGTHVGTVTLGGKQ